MFKRKHKRKQQQDDNVKDYPAEIWAKILSFLEPNFLVHVTDKDELVYQKYLLITRKFPIEYPYKRLRWANDNDEEFLQHVQLGYKFHTIRCRGYGIGPPDLNLPTFSVKQVMTNALYLKSLWIPRWMSYAKMEALTILFEYSEDISLLRNKTPLIDQPLLLLPRANVINVIYLRRGDLPKVIVDYVIRSITYKCELRMLKHCGVNCGYTEECVATTHEVLQQIMI